VNTPLKPPCGKPEDISSPKRDEDYVDPRPRNEKQKKYRKDGDKQNYCRIASFCKEAANVDHFFYPACFSEPHRRKLKIKAHFSYIRLLI
jgi:hypothetical protein